MSKKESIFWLSTGVIIGCIIFTFWDSKIFQFLQEAKIFINTIAAMINKLG